MANEFKIKKGLIVTGASGGTVVDIQGSQGQLFSVTDDLSGSIFAVSDISGVPIFDVNSSGLSTFDGLVSGITPVNAANFVTKAYVDGSGGGTGPFLPLAGGTLTGALAGTSASFTGALSSVGYSGTSGTFSASVTASGNSNSFGNTTTAALTATSGTFTSSVTAAGNSNSFGATTFAGNVTIGSTTSSSTILNLIKSTSGVSEIKFLNVSNEKASIQLDAAEDLQIFANTSQQIKLRSGGADALTLDSSQNATFTGTVTVNTANSNILTLNRTTSAGGYMRFQNDGTDKFYIGSRGTVSGSGGTGYDIYAVGGNDIRFFPGTLLALTLDTSANATFAGNVSLEDNKELIFGAATDFKIYHNSTTNVNHVSSQLDRQLSINGNIINLTNQANTTNYLTLNSTGATFAGDVTIGGKTYPKISLTDNQGVARTFSVGTSNETFTVRNETASSDAFTISNANNATFAAKAYGVAPITSDPDSTIATKGYVQSVITGATIYRGTWNPDVSLNSGYGNPNLNTVTQTSGYYYICSADGAATPNGTGNEPNTWNTGDWVIWNDDIGTSGEWQKIDNSSVLSGVGTGQTVALWQGASSVTDSETLGNAPITVSGNDTSFAGNVTAVRGFFNSGTTNVVATFTSTDGTAGIGLIDSSGNVELTATGNTFQVRPAGGIPLLSVNSSGQTTITNTTNDNTLLLLNGARGRRLRIQEHNTGNGGIAITSQDTNESGTTNASARTILLNAAGGNVGIGTTSPQSNLHVAGTQSYGSLRLTPTTANGESAMAFFLDTAGTQTSDAWVVGHAGWGNTGDFVIGNQQFGGPIMLIQQDGNVGIGTTNPAQNFVVSNSTNGQGIEIIPGTTGTLQAYNRGASVYVPLNIDTLEARVRSIGATVFNNGSGFSESMRITSAGNVGIGTTSPSYRLQVGVAGGLSDSIRIGSYAVAKDTRQYIGYARADTGLFESSGNGDTPSTVLAGVAGVRIVNTQGTLASSQADNSVQLLTHIYNGGSRVALHANYDGNVGIGTTSPDNILHIRKGDTTYASQVGADTMLFLETTNVSNALQFTSANTGQQYIMFGDDDPNVGWISYNHSDNNLNFRVNALERMRIDSAGNVGIGTTSPNDKLNVQSDALGSAVGSQIRQAVFSANDGNVTYLEIKNIRTSTTQNWTGAAKRIQCRVDSTYMGYMQFNGTGNNYGISFGTGGTTTVPGNVPERMRIDSSGAIKFNAYDSTNQTGTPTYLLGTDASGNIVKTNTVPGSGAGPYLPLSAGLSYPLTGDLYLDGSNQIHFVAQAGESNTEDMRITRSSDKMYFTYGTNAGDEAFYFDSSGNVIFEENVGIGTTSPDNLLHVQGSNNPRIDLGEDTNNKGWMRWNNADNYIDFTTRVGGTYYADTLVLRNGNVGIGNTNPLNKLSIGASNTGTQATTIPVGKFYNTGNLFSKLILGSDSANFDGVVSMDNNSTLADTKLRIYIGNGTSATTGHSNDHIVLQGNGNVGIGTSTPNAKLDIQGTQGQLFSVTDDLSGSIFAVSDISGVPIFDVNSSGVSYFDGNVGIGTTSPGSLLHLEGTNPELKIATAADGQTARLGLYEDAAGTSHGGYIQYVGGGDTLRLGIVNSTVNSFVITIKDNFNVGIGTTSPGNKLHVVEGTGTWEAVEIQSSSTTGCGVTLVGANTSVQWSMIANASNGGAGANNLGFHLTGAGSSGGSAGYKMIIQASSGNVGIGTTSPGYKLTVNGDVDVNNGAILAAQAYGINLGVSGYDIVMPTTTRIAIKTSSSERVSILNNGNVGIGITGPAVPLDVEGKIRSNDSNSGDYLEIFCDGSVSGDSYIENTNNNIQIKSAFATSFSTSGSVAMFIKNNQNVGIGTVNPGAKLDVAGIIFAADGNKGTPGYSFASDPDTGMFRDSANVLVLGVNGDTRIKISNTDIVTYKPLAVNTTSITSGVALDVGGVGLIGDSGVGDFYLGNYATANHFRFHTNNSNTYFDMNCGDIYWRQGTSTRYQFFASTANMTIQGTLTQNSDARTKENVIEISDCISKVKAMRGVYYNRTDFNTEVTKVGVIAQEVEAVLPELVLESPETGLKSVAYSELTSVLINAIKEQQEIIEDLKTRITKLEN